MRTDDPKLKVQEADLIRIAARINQCAEEYRRYGLARTRYRGSRADLDGTSPIVKAMAADAYQKYLNKVRPLMQDAEYNVYRYQPELSYRPDMAGSGSTTGSR